MRTRRPSPDHAEAVARRLALLSAELDADREVAERRAAHGPDAPHPDVVRAGLTRVAGMPLPGPGDRVLPGPGIGPGLGDPALGGAVPRVERAPADDEAVAHAMTSHLPAPTRLPVPGRHAQRRPGRARVWRSRPPADVDFDDAPRWPSPGAWDAGQVNVVLAGLLLAVVVGCGWLVMGSGEPDVVPVTPLAGERAEGAAGAPDPGATGAASPAPASASTAASTPAQGSEMPGGSAAPGGEIVVDVAGKVRRPGLVVLPAGARVADALDRAGGVRRGADTSMLNLARLLVDGEQVLVGVPGAGAVSGGAPGAAATGGSGAPAPAVGPLVSINSADVATLDTLPGVGPVTATAIVEWRTQHGGFTAVDDLLEVRGIGESTLARLKPLVTL